MITAVDPSVDSDKQGWARFEHGKLADCGIGLSMHAGHLVIECPEYRRNQTARVNPNDLIKLAVHVGALKGAFELDGRAWFAEAELVTPSQWKGSVPKDIHGQRIIRALSLKECEVYQTKTHGLAASRKHNVVDAIGLGLWKLGR